MSLLPPLGNPLIWRWFQESEPIAGRDLRAVRRRDGTGGVAQPNG